MTAHHIPAAATDDVDGDPREFAAVLLEVNGGASHHELSEALRDLVRAVTATGRKGSITYTLTLEPLKRRTDTLVVTDAVTVKAPQPDRTSSVFYTDDDGRLVREDPNQPALFGQVVDPTPTAPVPVRNPEER